MKLSGKKMRYLLPLLVFLLIAGLLGAGLGYDPRHLPSTRIDKPAPQFDLALLNQEGEQFSPQQMRGKRWLMNIWASWCAGCRVEHPLLNRLAQQTSIPMVGLNYKDQPDNARRWLANRGNPYSLIPMDQQGDVGIDWGVYGVPETFVIDEQGIIVFKHVGPLTPQVVEQELLPLFITDDASAEAGEETGGQG